MGFNKHGAAVNSNIQIAEPHNVQVLISSGSLPTEHFKQDFQNVIQWAKDNKYCVTLNMSQDDAS